MPKKIKITEKLKEKIVELYNTETLSLHKLGESVQLGHKAVKKILLEKGVTINPKGRKITHGASKELNLGQTIKYETNNKVAKCKKTGIIFNDVNNDGGHLTVHILETYNNVIIPRNTYQRKKYEKMNGKRWYEEYFDIIDAVE